MAYNINFKNAGFKKFAAVFVFIFMLSLFYGNFVFSVSAEEKSDKVVIQDINLEHAFGTILSITAGQAGYQEKADGVGEIIGLILKIALSFLGVIFLILMVYGGYLWMTARGKEEQVNKAKELITAAVIGLVIVVGAYALSWFVLSKLGEGFLKPSSSTPPP